MLTRDLQELLLWSFGIGGAIAIVYLLFLWILRLRGVFVTHTKFGVTMVFDSVDADKTPVRLLNVNGTYQSVSYVPENLRAELAVEYHRLMAAMIEEVTTTPQRSASSTSKEAARIGREVPRDRVLILGGGGFSLPKYLIAHDPTLDVTAVEIDPKIIKLARERFFLTEVLNTSNAVAEGRAHIVAGDAWKTLQDSSSGSFSVIVNEVFAGKRPLGPMKTAEGAQLVHDRLCKGGLYLADIRCPLEGSQSAPLTEVVEKFGHIFAHVAYVPEWPDTPKTAGNNVLIATDAEYSYPEGAIVIK